ncbi:MAG: hypothetical protein ABSF98_28455 [Bryobacteraceae bacterium]
MHRLASGFILGYHGCDRSVGERLLGGNPFRPSNNEYDWLGPGIYFWEANPGRGMDFARETARRKAAGIREPFVIGAVLELGLCLDLTTTSGIEWVRIAYDSLARSAATGGVCLPANSADALRRNLDCAVIRRLHSILEAQGLPAVDTVKGVFTEGKPIYPGAGFDEKTHIQIVVRNPGCIKGVFRVPGESLEPLKARRRSKT